MKNKMTDLRNHLFAALEGLADKEKPMKIETAKAICDVSKQIIDSAKVEVDFVKATGMVAGSEFLELDSPLAAGKSQPLRLAGGKGKG